LNTRRLSALLVFLLGSAAALAVDLPPLTPDPAAFKARRERFMAQLPPKSVAILRSAPLRTMSRDIEYLYRPNSSFYYLTGIDEDDVTAVFRPDAPDGSKYLLFLRPRDVRREAWVGVRVGPAEAVAAYGADAAFPLKDFNDKLSGFDPNTYKATGYLAGVERLYLSDGGDEAWAARFRDDFDPLKSRRQGPSTLVDAGAVIDEMRLIKDEEDLRFLRRAAEISVKGHVRAMQAAAPGRWEFEVQQALDGYCYGNGARRMAYPSIVGSGPNSCVLHYDQSSRQLKVGEVVLNDSDAEYGYYAKDITRT
jgi:Xaa-Pro aminopeptidase